MACSGHSRNIDRMVLPRILLNNVSWQLAYLLESLWTIWCIVILPSHLVKRASFYNQQHSPRARIRCCTVFVFNIPSLQVSRDLLGFWCPRQAVVCQVTRSPETAFKKLLFSVLKLSFNTPHLGHLEHLNISLEKSWNLENSTHSVRKGPDTSA